MKTYEEFAKFAEDIFGANKYLKPRDVAYLLAATGFLSKSGIREQTLNRAKSIIEPGSVLPVSLDQINELANIIRQMYDIITIAKHPMTILLREVVISGQHLNIELETKGYRIIKVKD